MTIGASWPISAEGHFANTSETSGTSSLDSSACDR
jgi:hypothetical protein